MTSIKPIRRKATITLELSFYEDVSSEEIRGLCAYMILAAGARASQSQYHLQWVARTEAELEITSGHNHESEMRGV